MVMLGDDIMHERAGVLDSMLSVFDDHRGSVVALKEVNRQEICFYGCATPEPLGDRLVRILDVVEKPAVETAPSNLAVMGRYVFTPDDLRRPRQVKPGKGGEIQLTDAIELLLAEQTVYGWTFTEGRYDVGNKLDYLRATVELALEREDLGPGFRAFLADVGPPRESCCDTARGGPVAGAPGLPPAARRRRTPRHGPGLRDRRALSCPTATSPRSPTPPWTATPCGRPTLPAPPATARHACWSSAPWPPATAADRRGRARARRCGS